MQPAKYPAAWAIDAYADDSPDRGLLGRLSMAAFEDEGLRLMTLDVCRVGIVLAVASLLGLLYGAFDLWWLHRAAAQSSAAATLAVVDARLDEIDRELSQLTDDAAPSSAVLQCPPALTSHLVRASLTSTLVRRFIVGERGTDFACGPDGPIPALAQVQRTGFNLALFSTPAFGAHTGNSRAVWTGSVIS